jgi:hypothetical protein
MSDQGYPGGPAYGQQPPYDPGQPPQFPQQPPYDPNQTAQFPQQPPYDPNQTAQFPQQPPYDPNQAAPYGQPVYPAADYGQPPQYGGPGGPPQYPGAPPTGSGGGGRRGLLLAVAVVVLAALGVGAFFLFSGSDSASADPADAARALLDAGKSGDINAAKQVLCASDISAGLANQLNQSGKVTNYKILNTVSKGDNRATVTVTVTTQKGGTQTEPLPVVKEDGKWKVCFTGGGQPPGGPSDFPSPTGSQIPPTASVPSISLPSISLPPISNLPSVPVTNPCAVITDPNTVALVYVGAAEIGQTDVAQACVFENSVPRSATESLATTGNGLFAPTGSHGTTYEFESIDGTTRLAVTVTKESDGNYYITALERQTN